MSSWTPPMGWILRTRGAFLSLFFFSLFSRGDERVDSILLYSSSRYTRLVADAPSWLFQRSNSSTVFFKSVDQRIRSRVSKDRTEWVRNSFFYMQNFFPLFCSSPIAFCERLSARAKNATKRAQSAEEDAERNSLLPSLLEPEEESECFFLLLWRRCGSFRTYHFGGSEGREKGFLGRNFFIFRVVSLR